MTTRAELQGGQPTEEKEMGKNGEQCVWEEFQEG